MTLTDLFTQINIAYRGTDDDAPTLGTSDGDMWLETANRKQNEWSTDADNNWESEFEVRTIGTVSSGTQTYDLDDDFIAPSDKITVTTLTGQTIDYKVVKPSERDRSTRSVYVSGRDPQTLTFQDPILSTDQIVGGTINVAGYYALEDLSGAADTIQVDDPYWLVFAVASELAFNDLTYEDKAADLVAKANNLWAKMVKRNRKGTSNNPRTARTNVTRIRGFR